MPSPFHLALKRAIDFGVALAATVMVLSWLVPLLGCVILLDSRGPILFLQRRHKKNGRIFRCIKFRTMVVNPDADVVPAGEGDCRITRIGRWLRRYHIDELPQLLNVLVGDMSLVGPRPYMLVENLRYRKLFVHYEERHRVRPGITGLAQSLGHFGFTEDLERIGERVRLDLVYVRHYSPGMDARILLRTLSGFRRKLPYGQLREQPRLNGERGAGMVSPYSIQESR